MTRSSFSDSKKNYFRLENETIRPDISLLLGLTIQNPQTPPPYPPRPSRPSFMATPYTGVVSMKRGMKIDG